MHYLVGIDEAGRGPLAGPVAVGAAMVRAGFDWSLLGRVRDSKKMTSLSRERLYRRMRELRQEGALRFSVAFASHALIDERGIAAAVNHAIARAIARVGADPATSNIFLDGALYAPQEYRHQQTIVGGDDVLPIISLAAIAAKVRRDRLMRRLARTYPAYGFDIHKGYPTCAHRAAIRRFGPCDIHRLTYCKNLLSGRKSV